MPKINPKVQNNPKKDEIASGFLGGLNTFQDETLLKDSELTKAKNIILSVDGIEPRPGTLIYGGDTGATKVLGLFGYYNSSGTRELLRVSNTGKLEKKSGNSWSQIGSKTYSTTARMNFLQARNNVFLFNGVDALTYYSGSALVEYTALTSPTALTVKAMGTAGPTAYSYRVSAFNTVGETLASTNVSITNGNATLDVTNYNRIGWDLVSGATGYNVYGRKSGGLGETFLITVYPESYYSETLADANINTGNDQITVDRDTATGKTIRFGGGGTMPTGLTADTTYYAIKVDATHIKVATSAANAAAGTAIDITGVGSGTRILYWLESLMFNDTNTTSSGNSLDPSTVILPPESNSTTGIICKKAVFAQSRIFAAGDPSQPSRLYYGGVGSNIGNFSFSDTGGGATDIFKNDGSIIRDILPFQGGVIVWKDNAIYKFYFNALGQPTLEEITRSFGGVAWRGAKHVENDVIFPARKDGRLAFYSLGNQENYAAGILRTNELSVKVAPNLKDVNNSLLEHASAFYFNNIYGCAIATSSSTVNDRMWCLDSRFGAWTHWDNLKANVFCDYTDTDGSQKLLYGDEVSGYAQEMFREERSDNGAAISVEFSTKAFNQKQFHKYKKYYSPVFQFKDVTTSGAISGEIIVDGAITEATFTVNKQTTGGAGFGVIMVGETLWGDAPGGNIIAGVSSDTIVELSLLITGRSIKYAFRSNTANARYKFLSLVHAFKILEKKRLPSSLRFFSA